MVIHYTSWFIKTFKNLPHDIQQKAIEQENRFKKNPHDPRLHSKALKGEFKNLNSFRVTRNYRVLFCWKDNETVLFYEIGDRKWIYR